MKEDREKLIRERTQFRKEIDLLNHKMVLEHKRLKDETLFFDKKMEILQDGFKHLEEEKEALRKEKYRFKTEQDIWKSGVVRNEKPDDVIAVLFKGVSNPITLRKRYKELLKIFHPDNLCGDEEMVQLINREYERRKRAEQKPV